MFSSGLLPPTVSIVWAVFHEWVGIAQDMWRAPWCHKLSYLLREPGWSHDGSRETSATLKARANVAGGVLGGVGAEARDAGTSGQGAEALS